MAKVYSWELGNGNYGYICDPKASEDVVSSYVGQRISNPSQLAIIKERASRMDEATYNKPTSDGGYMPWGIDEIGWFNQQPDWYRHQWVEYAYNRVRELDSTGYFCMPGIRSAALLNSPTMYYYHANSKYSSLGNISKNDELAIRKVWAGADKNDIILDQIVDPDKDNFADPSTNW